MKLLEQTFQQISIAADIIKCYNREQGEKSEIEYLMKDEEFKHPHQQYTRTQSFKKNQTATNFELEINITDDCSFYLH